MDLVKEFGPIPLYWEGLREKFIQLLKPLISGLRDNNSYCSTKLERVQERQAVEEGLRRAKEHGVNVGEQSFSQGMIRRRYHSIKIYSSRKEILDNLSKGQPISGYVTKENMEKFEVAHRMPGGKGIFSIHYVTPVVWLEGFFFPP